MKSAVGDYTSRPIHLLSILVMPLISVTLIAAATSCTSSATAEIAPTATALPILDPSTATWSQVFDHTRAAMVAIASYKTRGSTMVEYSDEDDDGGSRTDRFTEWRIPDRYRIRWSDFGTDTGEETTNEIRFIGNRIFRYNTESGWVEQPEGSVSGVPAPLFSAQEKSFSAHSLVLVSIDEVTDDGIRVYRFEFIQDSLSNSYTDVDKFDALGANKQTRTTLLIDQETFLFVTMIQEERVEYVVTKTKNGVPTFSDEWSRTVTTSHYYDYDRSVSINPPAEYTTWADFTAPTPTATAEPPAHMVVTERNFTLPQPGSTFMEQLLGQLPVPEQESFNVTLNNFEALRNYAGVERPGPELDSAAALEAMMPMFVPPIAFEGPLLLSEFPFLAGFDSRSVENQFKYLGMDFRSVDQTAVIDVTGFELLIGEYSLERTRDAIRGCEECVESEIKTFDGVDYFSSEGWKVGDGQKPPLFRAGTRNDNILVQDGLAVAASTPERINAYIQSLNGEAPSLLDTGDFALVANGMAALGAISAKFTTRDFSRSAIVGGGLELEKVNMVDSGPLMRPFGMVAYGSGHDGSSQFTALVIAHESNELALINSEILVQRIREAVTSNREPWTDLIESIEFEVAGRLLLARIYLHRKYIGFPLAFNPNHMPLLIVHE